MILACNCNHPVQDQLHGKGNRVHNMMKSGSYRCSVCKSIKAGKIEKVVEKKK